MKPICPVCLKKFQSARVTYYIKNGTRVFPHNKEKCFHVLRCDCGQQKSPTTKMIELK